MYIGKREWVRPYINGLGITAGRNYFVYDGSSRNLENGLHIQDDDGMNHHLSAEYLLENAEIDFEYIVTICNKARSYFSRPIHITKRLLNDLVIESLFDFGGTISEEKALVLLISNCEESNYLYTLSGYCAKMWRKLQAENL